MALSVYPGAIPSFPSHRNLLDDVDANHINAIQRELSTMATVVGVNPAVYNDVMLAQGTLPAVPDDDGGLESETATYTRPVSTTMRVRDHGTVSARLDYVERGQRNHCFKMSANRIDVPSRDIALSKRPIGIRFAKPAASNDPFGMYNGVGVTLRKSGFWVIQGTVMYNLFGNSPAENAKNEGMYQATIDRDQQWLEGMDRVQFQPGNQDIALNCSISGFFERGSRITLRTSHNSGKTQWIRLARMTGFMIRENVG